MKLYTSLTQAKMALNNGVLPPVPPLTVEARRYIDPAFTLNGDGMGGIVEDKKRGLRCPVRGCGEWSHLLAKHLNTHHAGIGGAQAIRRVLDIPESAPMVSTVLLAKWSAARKSQWRNADYRAAALAKFRQYNRVEAGRRGGRASGRACRTVGAANLRDRCVAQISHKLIDLEHLLGHSPTYLEFQSHFGDGLFRAIERTFGSFSAAKAQCGLAVYKTGYSRDDIYESLDAYRTTNGALPTKEEARNPERLPIIPSSRTILRVLGISSWPLAMQHVAEVLGVEDHRYSQPMAVA